MDDDTDEETVEETDSSSNSTSAVISAEIVLETSEVTSSELVVEAPNVIERSSSPVPVATSYHRPTAGPATLWLIVIEAVLSTA